MKDAAMVMPMRRFSLRSKTLEKRFPAAGSREPAGKKEENDMAKFVKLAVNAVTCSACRGTLIPERKPDGGAVFGGGMVHAVKPIVKGRDLCKRYRYTAVVESPRKLTREERRQAKWDARNAALDARLKAEREAEKAAMDA
jgi:hypothetical protein